MRAWLAPNQDPGAELDLSVFRPRIDSRCTRRPARSRAGPSCGACGKCSTNSIRSRSRCRAETRAEHGFIGLDEALRTVHLPDTKEDIERAQDRLRFDRGAVSAVGPRDASSRQFRACGSGLRSGRRRDRGPVRGDAPVHSDGGTASSRGGDLHRPCPPTPDEPPSSGRGRVRQDDRGSARDAAGRRCGLSVRVARTHRGPGKSARAITAQDDGLAGCRW